MISPDVVLGNNVKVQNNVSIYTGVILEDDVFCGPSMVFTNVVNPRSHVVRKHEYQRTHVGRGASFGANCTVVCGHDIGRYAFVGAGAVVTKHVPDYALVVGNPGRITGWVCECGIKLANGATPPAVRRLCVVREAIRNRRARCARRCTFRFTFIKGPEAMSGFIDDFDGKQFALEEATALPREQGVVPA